MKWALLLAWMALVNSISGSHAQARAQNSIEPIKTELLKITERWNSEFHTTILLRFDTALPPTLNCIPHRRGNAIFICDSVLRLMLDFNGFENASRAAYLVLFHELSHFVLAQANLKANDLRAMGIQRPSIWEYEFDFLLENLQHDNVDGFAAKMMREFGYALPTDLNAFDLTQVIDTSEIRDPIFDLTLIAQPIRIAKISRAYTEGWKAWAEYERLVTPCNSYDAKDSTVFFLLKQKLTDSSNLGPTGCEHFDAKTIQTTVDAYAKKFF